MADTRGRRKRRHDHGDPRQGRARTRPCGPQLVAGGASALRALGVGVPDGVTVKFVEDSATVRHLVIPAPEGAELTDADLDKVAGGAGQQMQMDSRWGVRGCAADRRPDRRARPADGPRSGIRRLRRRMTPDPPARPIAWRRRARASSTSGRSLPNGRHSLADARVPRAGAGRSSAASPASTRRWFPASACSMPAAGPAATPSASARSAHG